MGCDPRFLYGIVGFSRSGLMVNIGYQFLGASPDDSFQLVSWKDASRSEVPLQM